MNDRDMITQSRIIDLEVDDIDPDGVCKPVEPHVFHKAFLS